MNSVSGSIWNPPKKGKKDSQKEWTQKYKKIHIGRFPVDPNVVYSTCHQLEKLRYTRATKGFYVEQAKPNWSWVPWRFRETPPGRAAPTQEDVRPWWVEGDQVEDAGAAGWFKECFVEHKLDDSHREATKAWIKNHILLDDDWLKGADGMTNKEYQEWIDSI